MVMLIAVFLFPDQVYFIAVTSFAVGLAVLYLLRGFRKISTPNVLRLLSIQNPDLQYSADLLTQESTTLSHIEALQKQYVVGILTSGQLRFSFPNRMKGTLIFLIICCASYLTALAINERLKLLYTVMPNVQASDSKVIIASAEKTGVKNVVLKIIPPSYVGQKKQVQQAWDVIAAEGSTLQWAVGFHEEVAHVEIKFSDKSVLVFTRNGTSFIASSKVENRMLYELIYRDKGGKEVYSDFHKIDITYDTPPLLQVHGIDQFSEHDYDGNSQFDIEVAMSDDYGISAVYMIATIAQGTGESVMFREEKIQLDGKIQPNVQSARLPKHLDLKSFGMQPGDELYFYVEAKDNCTFKENITRTETYIMSVRDTSTSVYGMDGGLGIDLMPEYFRSQRQIIIDTEKLLKNKSKLIKHDFNSTSNELGFDQKTLHLKYGQFLGEEDESGIAIEDHPEEVEEVVSEEEGGEAVDALDGFRHDHDKEGEHERVNEGEEQEEDPLDEFMHDHDSAEEATFFSNTLKGKLKAAMALMWDAELYLRLYQPEKSLPYQYKALKLIKEIKNHARVYVHRIGFDPPPIKEEVRLTGDLSEIKNNNLQAYDTLIDHPGIRKIIALISDEREIGLLSRNELTASIQEAGNELAQIAIDNPGNYLFALQKLRDWINEESLDNQTLINLQNELIRSLPKPTLSSSRKSQSIDPLTKTYLKILQQKTTPNE
jgi:hypothetical protein